jgi:tetratricopeptide (TPR) repeat protein
MGTYFNQQDDFDSATYYYNEGLALAKKINLPPGLCAAYNNTGDMFYKYEHYEKALEMYLKALEVSEKNNLYSSMGSSYGSMGSVFEDQGKKDLAISYYYKAIEAHKTGKDTIRLPATYVKLSSLSLDLNDVETAKKYSDEALRICDQLLAGTNSPPRLNALNLYRRGALDVKAKVYEKHKEFDQALAIYKQLAEDVKDLPGVQQKVTYQVNLASVYEKTGKFDQSLEHLQQSLDLLKEDSIPYLYQNVYEGQANTYAGLGMYEKAFQAHKKFKEISDSILNKDNLTITADMQTKYETEKKEQQIATLNIEKKSQRVITGISIGAFIVALGLLLFALRANRLQKKLFAKEKELQKKEMEKRMFELEQTALRAQMNPHFIFNSLNSVQRFVINNDAEGVNQYLSTFANLIRQTLENSGKSLITLKDELRYLETYLRLEQMRGDDKFKYLINVNPDIDTEETYIPNMIIQPYLENSVIHGMAGKKGNDGIISLTISKNHKLSCVVDDNGTGIAVSKTYRKTTGDDHESMGTAITEKRIEMFNTINHEKIELEVLDKSALSSPESGTRIMIKFPLTITAN